MLFVGDEPARLTHYICNLRGKSQAILAKASDGLLYVVKFANGLQGSDLLFNESMGTELYRFINLPVPSWRVLSVTDSFIDQNQNCWLPTPEGNLPPKAGLCFGSRFLTSGDTRLFEILPGNYFQRVRNRDDFWLAWLIDICAGHSDNRQAIFRQDIWGSFDAVFVGHGHMFCAHKAERPLGFRASRFLDQRIYPNIFSRRITSLTEVGLALDVDWLWLRVRLLPDEWKSDSAVRRFSECLNALSSRRLLESVFAAIIKLENRAVDLCDGLRR
jgi:hypothetical protein